MISESARERFLACLRDVVLEIASEAVAQVRELGEWIDQSDSPLGKNRHLRLCRAGTLPARKQGKKWLVHRDDMNRFIAADDDSSRAVPDDRDEIDRDIRELGIPMRQPKRPESPKPNAVERSRRTTRRR